MRPPLLPAAAALILSLGALSCASSSMFQISQEEERALQAAMDAPLTFVVPRDRSIETWDRAHVFFDRYSTMKLQTVTDSLLLTYETPLYTGDPAPVESGSGIRYGYSISRSRVPEGIQYVVACTPSSKLAAKDADQNAHIAAAYIRSGTIPCVRCIVR